jgi:hypothetical protein
MAQNYGYEFLMTELPTYMKQILRFSIKEVSRVDFVNPSSFINCFRSSSEWNPFIGSLPWNVDFFVIPLDDR